MGMSARGLLGGLALASIGMPLIAGIDLASGPDMTAISRHGHDGRVVLLDEYALAADTIEVRRALSRDGRRRRRAKGPQAKPRKRSNLRHVSRRTRRKHRRAA